jgi:hypothetical protein
MRCPKCGAYFVVQDRFGFFCGVGSCGWDDYKKESEAKNV